ncbi:MAG: carbohydrate porin [Candidatus Latescibacter sp.]|nr:carbohydrate porin [Candidatus Latescibacter sp.]
MKVSVVLIIPFLFCADMGVSEENADFPAMKIDHLYTGEEFTNLSGGIKKGHSHRSRLDLTITIDTEKAGLWKGGELQLCYENGLGKGITREYVGDLQVLSNIDAHDFSQISEYYIGQFFLEGRLHFKIGKQDANNDFNVTEPALDFINSSFGLMPNVPLPTFPNPSLGISGTCSLHESMSLGAGLYDGKGKGGSWGFSTAFGPDPVSCAVVEYGISHSFFGAGKVKLGTWRHSGKYSSFTDNKVRSTTYGGYLILEHKMTGSIKNEHCLDSFFQYGFAPGEFNEVKNYLGFGLKISRLIGFRPNDSFGIGMARAGIGDVLCGMKCETACEMYYLGAFRKAITIQPDIQYIINTGGTNKDSLVGGIRFSLRIDSP